MISNYDKFPSIDSGRPDHFCATGWDEISDRLSASLSAPEFILCVECYPGTDHKQIADELAARLNFTDVVFGESIFLDETRLHSLFDADLTDDPVFALMSHAVLIDFVDPDALKAVKDGLSGSGARVLLIGTGASLIAPETALIVYADMPRWELQRRQRAGRIGNLGLSNFDERPSLKYKRAYFLDWRVADRHKQSLFKRSSFFLDTTADSPKMLAATDYMDALELATRSPFRVVPFFDPGPWGGQWMKKVCDLPRDQPNYAWCFDCVPEENSLLLRFGDRLFELPAINCVLLFPEQLLGESIHARFGKEFPIRFDLLDTMGGGNLSLQVHPLTEYIQEHFGMHYTQDESYYLLDAEPGAIVWLGLREDTDADAMSRQLEAAAGRGAVFRPELHVNSLPAKKHDHFLIPAGTVHCSGAGSMVLEISATPYIFTFKMWDWERFGLDGRPRPVHLAHAFANIQWQRRATWVDRWLARRPELVAEGENWREERTGLHTREFIETRRHWFTGPVRHDTRGTLNVLNLVEGREAIIESPSNSFAPFIVHYAETVIIPAAAGAYTISPYGESVGSRCATIKAYVRDGNEVLRWADR